MEKNKEKLKKRIARKELAVEINKVRRMIKGGATYEDMMQWIEDEAEKSRIDLEEKLKKKKV